jgi:tocopherol O-methyltransferase
MTRNSHATDTAGARNGLLGSIREHYNRISFFYRALWGVHIHHGYWKGDESPEQAQINLIARLAHRAGIPSGADVLDVGCGLGGSALWLAHHLECTVTGITISPVQAALANRRARRESLESRARFQVMDANRLALPANSFDAVWIVECSEHLADKPRFIDACAQVLRPGGRLALCAWLSAARPDDPRQAHLVAEVCHGMLCPGLAAAAEYVAWMRTAGFVDIEFEDATARVAQTWDHCIRIVRRPWLRAMLRFADAETRAFVASFPAMQEAYAVGAMTYGIFTARKP